MQLSSVAVVRRTVLAKVFAVCLVALAVTPFTAPFSLFDLADLFGSPSSHGFTGDSDKQVKTSTDSLVGVTRSLAPSLTITALDGTAGSCLERHRAAAPLVLRI